MSSRLYRGFATCDLCCFSLHLLFLLLYLSFLFWDFLFRTCLLILSLFNRLHHFLQLLPLPHHLIHCRLHLHLHLPHSFLILSQLAFSLHLLYIDGLWLLSLRCHLLHRLHHIPDLFLLLSAHLFLSSLEFFFHLSKHHFPPHLQFLFHSLLQTFLKPFPSCRRITLTAKQRIPVFDSLQEFVLLARGDCLRWWLWVLRMLRFVEIRRWRVHLLLL